MDGFDLSMGSFGFRTRQRFSRYILNVQTEYLPGIVGELYVDDTLIIGGKPSARELEMYKKKLLNFFYSYGLKITIFRDHTVVNYLVATLNLFNETFKPYHKNNENLNYISYFSNHHLSTKNALICNISKRISSLSSKDEIYNETTEYYNIALDKALIIL